MNKNLLIGLVVIAVLVVGGYFLLTRGGGYQVPSQQVPAPATTEVEEKVVALETGDTTAEVREIVVSGSEYSFSPSSVAVNAGESIKLTFKNSGRTSHDLTVEGIGVSTKTIGAGQSDSIEFTPETSGTLTFYCSVGNHRQLGMEGELVVE